MTPLALDPTNPSRLLWGSDSLFESTNRVAVAGGVTKIDAPWLEGNIRPAITWKWAETAESMMADRMAGVRATNFGSAAEESSPASRRGARSKAKTASGS